MPRVVAIILGFSLTASSACDTKPMASEPPGSVGDPPGGDLEMRRVGFNENTPHAEVNPAGGWKIVGSGTYRYDRDDTFKEFRLEVVYVKGAVSTAAGIFKFTDETTVVPGQFSQDFNLRAPVAGDSDSQSRNPRVRSERHRPGVDFDPDCPRASVALQTRPLEGAVEGLRIRRTHKRQCRVLGSSLTTGSVEGRFGA